MAYIAKDLHCVAVGGGAIGLQVWVYDTVDAIATVYAAGYISDAGASVLGGRGMEKGDIVILRRWTTAIPTTTAEKLTAAAVANVLVSTTIHMVLGISTAGAADLTDGLAITITNT